MNLVGKVIGNRYEILEKIGEGGMATVYKARCNILKRYVAVKVLRDEFITDEEFIKRFNTEAQAAASLTHPNIVSIFDVGHEDNIYYIVMELVQGKTLKEIINEDGVLPWKWSVNIAIQVASALDTAHKNNIVHRDIAKVTDFGIAKAVSNSTITAFGTTIGSVHYFSPEHARGGYTDAKSDIYSLGVVMYEMLTGRVPFDADTPVSIALKHMQEKPVEPMKLNPSIPYAVNKIIMKAMEKDTSLRYQSATEMLKDLSMALKDPEGDFVKKNSETMVYTQRIPTIGESLEKDKEEEQEEKAKSKAGYFAKHPKAKKVWMIVAIIAVLIALPIIGFFATQAILSAGQPKDVDLPNLVGKTLEEARQEIEGTNLVLESQDEYNDEVEAGQIISQEPPFQEGYKVKENSTITVVVSKGIELVTMQKVVGMTYEEAEKLLREELNLEVERVDETSQTVEAGYVTKQSVEEGEEIKKGEKVTLHVSSGTGIKEVNVPHVIGDTEADAKTKLEDLEVTVVYEEDATKVDGTVIRQSINAGTTVEEGTAITITVNRIEAIKTGTVKLNLKSLLAKTNEDVIEKDENGVELNANVELRIDVNDETVYSLTHRRDETDITTEVSGKGTVEIKIFVNGVRKYMDNFDLTVDNPVLTVD